MGEFLLKNLDKITNSIVDICFDDVVVLDVVTVVTKSYEKFIEFLKNQNLKKNYVQNTNLETSGAEIFFKD